MVTAADVTGGRINYQTARKASLEAFEKLLSAKSKPKKNDVLLTKDGALGRVALVGDAAICINQSVAILRPNNRIEPDFLSILLQADPYQRRMIEDAGGSTIKHIYITIVNHMPIAVPRSKAEQRAIAAALSDADELIAALEALIAKKRNLKQAAMQQLLTGKTRLPGFSGEWAAKRLGDILSVCHGKNQKEVEQENGKYPILATGGEIGRTNAFLFNKPSVLIGRKGTIDEPQFIDTPFWTIDTLFFTEISNSAIPKFMFYKFLEINWRSYNEASGVPSLSARTIETIEIAHPSLGEQTAIAEVLSDMDADITALEAQRDKAKTIKQGMMQELLTGKVRLI